MNNGSSSSDDSANANHDWFQNPVSGGNRGRGVEQASIYNQYRWHMGAKRASDAAKAAARAQAEAAQRAGMYEAQESNLYRMQQAEEQRRQEAVSALDRAYASPARDEARQGTYQTQLGSALTGISSDFMKQSQASGLAMARRGRIGSSYDAETQGDIAGGARTRAVDAENTAWGSYTAARDADRSQYENLHRALLAGDPQTAAQYQGMASAATGDADRLAQQSSIVDRQRMLQQMYGDAQSQQYGGYINAGANGVWANYGGRN